MRAAMSLLETMRRTSGLRPNVRTYTILMQGWIELKNMNRAMDLFKQMQRNKETRPNIVTYNLMINGWARSMKRMDMAENVMQECLNDPHVSPNERTFCALIRGYSFLHHKSRAWRAERMYFWLCKMRDSRIQPNMHTAKPFFNLGLYFPSVDGPFWKNYGVPYNPHRDR